MARLKSTLDILRAKVGTSKSLLIIAENQLAYEDKRLRKLRGIILRSKNQKTLNKLRDELSRIAVDTGEMPIKKEMGKKALLYHINRLTAR